MYKEETRKDAASKYFPWEWWRLKEGKKTKKGSGWNNGGSEYCLPWDTHCGSSEKKVGVSKLVWKRLTAYRNAGGRQGACDCSPQEWKRR